MGFHIRKGRLFRACWKRHGFLTSRHIGKCCSAGNEAEENFWWLLHLHLHFRALN